MSTPAQNQALAGQLVSMASATDKPGYQTSEFWVAALAPTLLTFMSDLLASKDRTLQMFIIGAGALIACVYIVARSLAKSASGGVVMLQESTGAGGTTTTATASTGIGQLPPLQPSPTPLVGNSPLSPLLVLAIATAAMLGLAQLGGCVAPSASKELAGANSQLVAQVSVAYTQQEGVTGQLIQVLGDQYVAQVTGNAVRQPVANNWVDVTTWKVSPENFTKSVQDAKLDPQQAYLVGEVRAGRMSQEQALSWLKDFAIVQAMSPERGSPVVTALCAQLLPVQQAQAAATQALAAHTARTAQTINALGELDATAKTWVQWANAQPGMLTTPSDPAAYKPWVALLGGQIKDPKQRAALQAALAALETPSPTVGVANKTSGQ